MQKEELNNLVTVSDLNHFSEKIISEIHRLADKNKQEFYSPSQFGKIVGMPYTTVVHYCKTRRLKARQDMKGGSWQIYACEIDRLKKEADINYLPQ
ncbi:hypothetical protein [Carboxylicivirga marina]|uniref:hypothetical protein n=1 Tax=Carboxylicivirga marina TaxID=2800988 RepID=UPI002596EA36|nr:hypothetical protein [uncultured Carboxylicivirga sp.]